MIQLIKIVCKSNHRKKISPFLWKILKGDLRVEETGSALGKRSHNGFSRLTRGITNRIDETRKEG